MECDGHSLSVSFEEASGGGGDKERKKGKGDKGRVKGGH